MSALKLRLKRLEKSYPIAQLLFVIKDGKYTIEQKQQIKEAEVCGREVKIVTIQTVDSNVVIIPDEEAMPSLA